MNRPQYYVFNGAAGALATDENALHAKTGETVRIFFGVGGAECHVVLPHYRRDFRPCIQPGIAYITAPDNVQTVVVPPGGATMVEFKVDVPVRYILVDHVLSRSERGLAGYLYVEGEPNPSVFFSDETPDGAGH